jgi:ribosomal subunit interface protein
MNIRIQVRHDAAREAIQKYITAEFEHISKKFTEGEHSMIVSAEFIVDQEGPHGHTKTFEAIIGVAGDTIAVKESSEEAHKAIDISMKVLEKLLMRHKEKHARPGAQIRHNVERSAIADVNEVI